MSFRRLLCKGFEHLADVGLLAGALAFAFELRFEGVVPNSYARVFWNWLPVILSLQCVALWGFGVHRLTWRFISLFEVRKIVLALAVPGVGLLLCREATAHWGLREVLPGHQQVPVSVILMDMTLSLLALVGLRALARVYCEWRGRRQYPLTTQGAVPSLLIGAGRRGAAVARELAEQPQIGIKAVGFLDDDPAKLGTVIQGVRVRGTLKDVGLVARRYHARQALITAAATGAELLRIVEACEAVSLPAKIVPPLGDLVGGRTGLAVRNLSVSDLLSRPTLTVSTESMRPLVRDRTVLVTGAGGSIGSQLCHELCCHQPATIVLVEQAENSLFHVHRRLAAEFPHIELVPCVADICDRLRMAKVFAWHEPAFVFHAAAHKHVPLMEWNPGEAIKNNILGTRLLADLAAEHGVERFVMISTDKAVNPTSIMGVSKRVAELYVQALSRRSKTRFVTVRFGNVWASAGSVVPIFQEQITKGGPVTVTHPEMLRYFMTIPEACQLVLQAAALGNGGEIFILDMGQPIKIVDLARRMIRMAGYIPDVDIKIEFTGMRPGEKLVEELSLDGENTEPTGHPRILKGRLKPYDWDRVNAQIEELCRLADSGDAQTLHDKLKEVVPEYRGGGGSKLEKRHIHRQMLKGPNTKRTAAGQV